MSHNNQAEIYQLISRLRKRTGLTYEKTRERMGVILNNTEYDRSTFDNKFRRTDRSPTYSLAEIIAIIRAYYDDLPVSNACTAYEAIQLFSFAGMRLEDHHYLKALFGEVTYQTAWSKYLQDHDLAYASDTDAAHVFLSYSNEDASPARKVRAAIESAGYFVWQDVTAIQGGEEWIREIEQAINGCCALVVITSRHTNASWWVREEILHAQRRHKPVIPLAIDDTPLPIGILQVNSINAHASFAAGIQQLLDTLHPCLTTGDNTTTPSHRQHEIDYLDRVLLEYGAWKTAYTPMAGTAATASGETSAIKTVSVPLQIVADFDQYIDEKLNESHTFAYEDDILRAIDDLRQFVVLGEPGGGKTATLWYLAANYASAAKQDESHPLPVLVQLGEIDEGQTLASKVTAQLGPLVYDMLEPTGRVALLLDGLDEIPHHRRAPLLAEIRSLVKSAREKNLVLVITCRTIDYTYDLELAGRVTLEPLDPLRIRQIIDNYITAPEGKAAELFWALAGTEARRCWERFVEDVGNSPAVFWLDDGLPPGVTWGYGEGETQYFYWNQWLEIRQRPARMFQLASNPFMLFMLMRVFVRRNQLPANRSKLLETFVNFLLTRREGVSPAAAHDLTGRLAALAFAIQQGGDSGRVSTDEARRYLGDEEAFRLAQSASILTSDGKQARFTHQLLQEYFAAYRLNHEIRAGVAAAQFWPPDSWWRANRWEETAILVAGFYEADTTPIVTWLQDTNPEITARCIVESGADTPASLQTALGERWAQRLKETPTAARTATGRALGILGNDPRYGVGLTDKGLPEVDWVPVPAGEFTYSDGNKHCVVSFAISRYPVTSQQFQAFIDASDGFYQPEWWQGLARREHSPGVQSFLYANHPRERVSWYDAIAFCRWLSHHLGYTVTLPTELQWEKAARGTTNRIYPYGNVWAAEGGNIDLTGTAKTCAVGLFPEGASPYGVQDMSGNVFEWCLNTAVSPGDINLSSAERRSLRGGSWAHATNHARADYRYSNRPELRRNRTGFRLIRSFSD